MPDQEAEISTRLELSDLYGPAYYASHCGSVPYERNSHWLNFFGGVADHLVRAFAPARVFDAGCALGLLVECFWDRGAAAYGRDVSSWAISQVRPDVRSFCTVGSIADPIEGEYDLVTCIEVLEHMPETDALRAIGEMAAVTSRILFSSSPVDFDEPTHCTVRPPAYWLARWAEVGFAPLITHDAGYLAPHAYVLERHEEGRSARDLHAFADRLRQRVATSQLGARLHEVLSALDGAETRLAAATDSCKALEAELSLLRTQIAARERDAEDARAEAGRVLDAAVARAATERRRQDTENSRLRATAAQRAAEARVEAAEARAETARVREHLLADAEQARAAVAERARATAVEIGALEERAEQLVRQERSRAETAEREGVRLRAEAEEARELARTRTAERDRVLASTIWRASWPLRAGVKTLMPQRVRMAMRKSLRIAWWVATGQVGKRLRSRKGIVQAIEQVVRSGLFDADWYAKHNTDVAESRLDPALHYVTIGGPEGRNPGPDFSVTRYIESHPDAGNDSRPALLHFLEHGGMRGSAAASRFVGRPEPEAFATRNPGSTPPPERTRPDGPAASETGPAGGVAVPIPTSPLPDCAMQDALPVAILPIVSTLEWAGPDVVVTPAAAPPYSPQPVSAVRTELVDIVICVRGDLDGVRACLESVVRCTMPPYQVILVDTAGDAETSAFLAKESTEQKFKLLARSDASSYATAANSGLRAGTAPWVVLLDSNTMVTPDWIDLLWEQGVRDPGVGMVGPLPSLGSTTLPRPSVDAEVVSLFVKANGTGSLSVPWLEGSCVMIRRDVLQAVGLLDDGAFTLTRGWDIDYAVRVRNAGWKLLAATGVYVACVPMLQPDQPNVGRVNQLLAAKHGADWCTDAGGTELRLAAIHARIAAAVAARPLRDEGRSLFTGKRVGIILAADVKGSEVTTLLHESRAMQRMGIDITYLSAGNAVGVPDDARHCAFPSVAALTAGLWDRRTDYDAVLATSLGSANWLPSEPPFQCALWLQDLEPLRLPADDPSHEAALHAILQQGRCRLLVVRTHWMQAEIRRRTGRFAALIGPSVDMAAHQPDGRYKKERPLRLAARLAGPNHKEGSGLEVLNGIWEAVGGRVAITTFTQPGSMVDETGFRRPWLTHQAGLDQAAVARLLSESDIYLDYAEQQDDTLLLLQAMSSGCAVIRPQRGGSNDVIQTAVNGILVDDNDAAACAAILQLAGNDALLLAMRRQAIADAARFPPEQAALRLMKTIFHA